MGDEKHGTFCLCKEKIMKINEENWDKEPKQPSNGHSSKPDETFRIGRIYRADKKYFKGKEHKGKTSTE